MLVNLAGCGGGNEFAPPPAPEVTVSLPTQKKVTEFIEFTGTTQPVESVQIRARVRGFLKERLFTEGAEVEEKKLLLVIDEEPFKIQLDSARFQLAAAQANLTKATESKSREIATAALALAESQLLLAKQEEQRQTSLQLRSVATQADIDRVVATRMTREAEVKGAKAMRDQNLATYDAEIASLKAQVTSAEVAVRDAELNLSYCRMTAPISGRISTAAVDLNNLVGDGQATVLATIIKIAPVYAYINVSESDMNRLREKIDMSPEGIKDEKVKVSLRIGSEGPYLYDGHIDYTDPALDAGTGTWRIRANLKNLEKKILPGMFVHVRIALGEDPQALLVPERALGTDQSGEYLLVVGADNKVEHRSVKTGVVIDGMRVITSNLKPDEKVIVEGLLRARPGEVVVPMPPKAKTPEAKPSASVAGRL